MWSLRRRSISNSGGFVFAEFAIALPLLILLTYGLAAVGGKIFYLGRIQLADYVLEEEVHEVLSRLIYDARAAKSVEIRNYNSTLIFACRTINEPRKINGYMPKGAVINDKAESRVYILYGKLGAAGSKIDYKRQTDNPTSPITGDNYFGATRVLKFEFNKPVDNVLRVTLEMQSEVSGHKIKISTAICMPGCESYEVH